MKLANIGKRIDRIASSIPPARTSTLSPEILAMSPREKIKYCAQIGLADLYDLAQRTVMSPSDMLKYLKAMTNYQSILATFPEENVQEEDYSGFSDDELRQYSEFSERARKVTIDTRDLSREQIAKMKAFALEMRENERK
jgi:hypothetical protein